MQPTSVNVVTLTAEEALIEQVYIVLVLEEMLLECAQVLAFEVPNCVALEHIEEYFYGKAADSTLP